MGGPHIDEEAVFGSTGEAHAGLMGVLWGPGINIAIILSFYGYRKWWSFVHGIFGVFACIYTLATSLPILFYTGIISKDSTQDLKYGAATLNTHYIVGIACMFVIVIQTVMGIITKLMSFYSAKSITIISMKKAHTIFGYVIIVLCKSDYVIINSGNGEFWGLIAQDIVFLIIGIIWKLKFPRMQAKINSLPSEEAPLKCIMSIRQLDSTKNYVVFSNYIYDIEPLRYYHPAGYQIVDSVKNKEVDRYIYGMFTSEQLPEVPNHSHSFKSFTLIGAPLAKLTIPSTFTGFISDEIAVSISSLKLISEKGRIYEMKLVREGGFTFQRYTSVSQLGRYYSLTINNQTTRLYTSVNFLIRSNKIFLKKHLQGYTGEYGSSVHFNRGKYADYQENQIPENTNASLMEDFKQNYVPILFKRYDGGKLTDTLVSGGNKELMLSCPKGQGLQFSFLNPGKIIMVAGGTGIYPFSDLIDLLYKQVLSRNRPQLTRQIVDLSPILADKPFDQFSFHLMAALNNLDELHPITFRQLVYLASHGKMELTLKMKDSRVQGLSQFSKVKMVTGSFEEELEKEIKEGNISKIFICGPPRMNENISRFLRESNKEKDLQNYLIL